MKNLSDQSDKVSENHRLPFSIQVKEEDLPYTLQEISNKYPQAKKITPVRQTAWWFEILVE